MFSVTQPSLQVVPAQLGFFAIYNPSLGTTDDTVGDQIVYYNSQHAPQQARGKTSLGQGAQDDLDRQRKNEQLRQIGLAQGMVEFGKSFSEGRSVDTVETEKCRIILHELEAGWWIIASIDLTVHPAPAKAASKDDTSADAREAVEYSSREVKPAILLLGDLLRAHATFLLHHASSMSALFVRTRRVRFVGVLRRYWDTYLASWNVLMHGNPANSLYNGLKIAACGELGIGVGEEDRGSSEREVLEGFVGRIDGLVDVIVSRFDGIGGSAQESSAVPVEPWLGSGNEPAAEDGVIFSGTGALSRKSMRDLSHWIEDLYRWGPYAYGVIDNPTSTRRTKISSSRASAQKREGLADMKQKQREKRLSHELLVRGGSSSQFKRADETPPGVNNVIEPSAKTRTKSLRPSLHRGPSSGESTDSESGKGNKLVQYLKLGYGTHWSLGGTSKSTKHAEARGYTPSASQPGSTKSPESRLCASPNIQETSSKFDSRDDSSGYYLIGLMGDIEDEHGTTKSTSIEQDGLEQFSRLEDDNPRLLLRTLTLELEREEDTRAEADISIDLGNIDKEIRSKNAGSDHTGTSKISFESLDRNKTKKLRVVVYVNKPFIFIFLFDLRTESLALTSLYRSLHHQVSPVLKRLRISTALRVSRPEIQPTEASIAPIYDLVWDPQLLTVTSTIPNIPDPVQSQAQQQDQQPWSRLEALNTHMQIIYTYISSTLDTSEQERICKTSRGWWVVWTRVPKLESEKLTVSSSSGQGEGPSIHEDTVEAQTSSGSQARRSMGTSTLQTSMYSGPAHPYLDPPSTDDANVQKDKEIFLIRRARDYVGSKPSSRFISGASTVGSESAWSSGLGIDTRRYIDALLNR